MKAIIYITIITLFSSCSMIMYSPEYLDLETTVDANYAATIYINGNEIDETEHRFNTYGMERAGVVNMDITQEGYRTIHRVMDKTRFNGYTIATIFTGYGAPFELLSNRNWMFPKKINLKKPVALPTLTAEDPEFLFLDVSVSNRVDFHQMHKYRKRRKNDDYESSKYFKVEDELDIFSEFNDYYYAEQLNDLLDDWNAVEQSGHVYNDGLYVGVSCEIQSYDLHYVKAKESKYNWYWAEMIAEFVAVSPLGDTIYKENFDLFSGEFTDNIPVEYAINDCLIMGLAYCINELQYSDYDGLNNKVYSQLESIKNSDNTISPAKFQENFLKLQLDYDETAVVVPVGNEGEALVSYDSYRYRLRDSVQTFDGKALSFSQVKIIPALDAVLIRLEGYAGDGFSIAKKEDLMYFEDYYVCGFLDEQLAPTISDVQLSALRSSGEINVLQLDESYSYLTSPVMLNKEGKAIGFVSRDVQNVSLSGISFCMPLFEVTELQGNFTAP